MNNTLDIDAIFDRHLDEVEEEIHRSWGLTRFKNFSQLHEVCDANMLGDVDLLIEEVGQETAFDIVEAVQVHIDSKMKTGVYTK